MQPYGVRRSGVWSDEDFGPPTKHRKITSKNRKSWRRFAHKTERAKAKQYIKKEIDGESRANGD